MKKLLALFFARNKEFYRDRGSLAWAFIMPPVILAVVALAFSREDQALFTVGVPADAANVPATLSSPALADSFRTITYNDPAAAIQRVQYHQLDIYLQPADHNQPGQYWVNSSSQKSKVIENVLLGEQHPQWQQQQVSGRQIRYVDWAIPGILAMNLMYSGLFGVGYVIVRYRKNGVLKRLQATPITPVQFLGAQVLSRLCIMLMVSTLVYICANAILNFVMLGSYITLFIVALVGIGALLSVGLIIAARIATEELANGLLNLVTFPMLLMSEVWFSLDGAPQWMHNLSNALPLTHMVKAARAVMLEGATLADVAPHLLVLAVMTAVFLGISAWLFRWREA